MKKKVLTVLLLGITMVAAAFGGAAVYGHLYANKGSHSDYSSFFSGQGRTLNASYAPGGVPEDFVEAAAAAIDGVVHIRGEINVPQRSQSQMIDPFEFFFGIPMPRQQMPQDQGRGQERRPYAEVFGSGVIISTDGYIITNNHVIENTDKLFVTLNDNEEFPATVIGTDPSTDIALIKIKTNNLKPIPIGDSDALKVGEWVLAVGNPFNLSSTVTAGIVSAKGRSTMAGGDLKIASFIQTDAVVNRGNSGGALVNTRGELVGINTMIYSQTGSYEGYSFAVPMSIASKVVADLKQYGAVQRAVLGIIGGTVNSAAKEEFDLKVNEGAVVADFPPVSSAKQAGIEKGDVITGINGTSIRSMAQVQEQIAQLNPGDVVKITVDRKGIKKTFNVQLKNAQGNTKVVEKQTAGDIGAAFVKLTKEEKQELGISRGIKVAGVSDGKFREAGIRKGFIILAINNVVVDTPKEANDIIEKVIASSPDKVLFIKGMDNRGDVVYTAVDLR